MRTLAISASLRLEFWSNLGKDDCIWSDVGTFLTVWGSGSIAEIAEEVTLSRRTSSIHYIVCIESRHRIGNTSKTIVVLVALRNSE